MVGLEWYPGCRLKHSFTLQHGPVTVLFRSTRPGNVIPLPKTSTLFGVGVHCQSQRNFML